jgi:hypothetical protein
MEGNWVVLYDDPKRTRGPSHTIHRDGCRDLARGRELGGNPQPLTATDLSEALVEAQYSGWPAAGADEGNDLGAVDLAPCARRADDDPYADLDTVELADTMVDMGVRVAAAADHLRRMREFLNPS